MKIYLIRHGITKANEESRYLGWHDEPLSRTGIEELQKLKEKNIYPVFDYVVSSPLTRCLQTIQYLMGDLKVDEIYDDLKEISFGDWEGLTYEDLKDNPRYREWIDNFNTMGPLGGECFTDFQKRIKNCFTHILDQARNAGKKNILVMTHGGAVRSILSEWIEKRESIFSWDIPNGTGYILEFQGDDVSFQKIWEG